MCFCDGKFFKVVNIRTGQEKLYKRVYSITKRFGVYDINLGGCLMLNGEIYRVLKNRHPECESVRRQYGIRLGEIPDVLRHLLPEHRR